MIVHKPFLCSPRAEPDLEFEGLLKRQHTRVKYFQGSLMNAMDLERAKVSKLQISDVLLWTPKLTQVFVSLVTEIECFPRKKKSKSFM